MLQQLKFNYPNEYQNIHYVSCLHFGHDRAFIYEPRGFKSVKEHDEGLIARWNERVKPSDIVHSIGDTIFGENAELRLEELFKVLNFRKLYLASGNHTAGWKQLYRRIMNERYAPYGVNSPEVYPLEYRPFVGQEKTVYFMPNYYEIYVGKQAAVLCHYPIYPHNGAGKGVYGIFGHAHGNNPKTNRYTGTSRVIDVCVESFGGPVSHGEIEQIFNLRTPEDVSHHTKDTKYAI